MKDNLRVIAGTYDQAVRFAGTQGYPENRLRYINNIDSMMGLDRGTKIWLVGTYYERYDWKDLRMEAEIRGYELTEAK